MMLEKYRVHDVARDLGVPTKEVADLLTAKLGSEYKSMTALNEQQLSMVFNHYTKQNQVENFEAYFAEGTAARDPARQPAKNTAPQQQKQQKQQKPAQQPRSQQKGPNGQNQNQNQNQNAQGQGNPERNAQNSQTPQGHNNQERNGQQGQRQPRQNNNGGRQQEERRGQGNRNNQNNNNSQNNREQNNNNRSQRQGQGQNKGDRQQRNNNGQQRSGQQDRQQRPGNSQQRSQNAPAAQNAQQNNNGKTPAGSKPKQRGSATVDMRAGSTQVEMERYNEKYDNLAQSKLGNRDVGVQKQKLTQRSAQRRGKPVMSRKEKEDAKMRRLEMERQRRQKLEITIPDQITVGDLAARLHVTASEIIKRLMALGVMASVNEVIDYDTAAMVSIEIGAKVEREVVVTIEERLFEVEEDDGGNLTERPPIVVVMGHVDHGKTSLLDAIRHANVTEGEAGGITQHIGAYQVEVNERPITFLDTPGHAAFTSMRARGAQVTDIAVLVVAADDGIMPQTVEAINHAKAAEVSIIVAINKIDKPHANPDKVMQELTEHGIVPEDWGGDVPCIRVSAKTKEGIGDLLEMIQLVADTSELKANPDRRAKGTVIEAKLDRGRGPVATILVQTGTLREGDAVIAGTTFGRVRTMRNDKGERVQEAGPSMPVEITGLDDVPEAGDTLNAVADERLAKELVEQRKQQLREEQFSTYEKVTLDNLFSHISQGDIKELPIIVKADVQGSVEAVKQSLEKLSNDEVRVKVIHGAVGAVNESDVMLADASNAVIVGFNVRPDPAAKENAERDGVELRLYRIIYDAINDVETAMKGMLAPKTREVDLGRAEVRQVYRITGVGMVAGCYVLDGKITRSAEIRVVRDGIIIADDKLASLKRFKDDVKEVAKGYECGMTLTKFSDIKEGDVFEAYEIEEYRE